LEKAEKENERLRKLLEEALRSLKRQAAPFSKGKPKSDPKSRWLSPGNFAVFLPVKLPCGTPLIYAGLSLLGIMIDNPPAGAERSSFGNTIFGWAVRLYVSKRRMWTNRERPAWEIGVQLKINHIGVHGVDTGLPNT